MPEVVPAENGTVRICGGGTKEAVTACEEFSVTLQAPVPVQATPASRQMWKAGVAHAVKFTTVPAV